MISKDDRSTGILVLFENLSDAEYSRRGIEARLRALGFGADAFIAKRSNFAGIAQALAARVIQIPKTEGEGNLVTLHLRGGRQLSKRARGRRAFEQSYIADKFTQAVNDVFRG